MKKIQFLSQAKAFLMTEYGKEKGMAIYNSACARYQELCLENGEEPKAMYMHTRVKIYPCIATLDAQIFHQVSREDALQLMFNFIKWRSDNMAKVVKNILKIPFLYKKVPVFFGNMTKKKFGTAAKFDAVFHEISNKEMRFDMTQCPYFDICKKYGYPEITKAFCRGDDILYGNMHPKLQWHRTKTIGDGDELCDFRITVIR